MEEKLLEKITKLGYTGEMVEPAKFSEALRLGPRSTEFTKFVAWIADELSILNDLDETVHAITSPEDASSFLLELSCFLKEIGCINERLMSGNVNQRLSTVADKYILLDYLCAELRASRIAEIRNLNSSASMDVTVDESDTAKHLKEMLIALNFPKPPENITPALLFTKLENKLTDVIKSIPPEELGNPLIIGELSESQWKELENIHKDLYAEYTMRRSMLLRRLDVTIQSFLWSESVKSREGELNEKYQATRQSLKPEPDVTLASLLAARDDIAHVEKTSSANVRKNTRSKINSVIIGAVPDRGGRPHEQEPPPPEMPPWQKDRVPGPPSFRGGRGGGGGSGSGDRGNYRGGRGGGRGRGGGSYGADNSGNQAYATTSYSSGFSGGNRGYGHSSGGYGSGNVGGGYGASASGSGYGASASGSGYGASASGSGYGASSSGSGYGASASGSGYGASASGSGYGASASGSGYGASASGSGYGSGNAGGAYGSGNAGGGYSSGNAGGGYGSDNAGGGYGSGKAGGGYGSGSAGGGYGSGSAGGGYGSGNAGGGYGSGNAGGGYRGNDSGGRGGHGGGYGGENRGGCGGRGGGFHPGDSKGYGHRYCYPSSVCGLPQADEKQDQGRQYQRGGGNSRGRGGRVQGGWNQGGNNSGSDGYQRGGYNRGRGSGGRQY